MRVAGQIRRIQKPLIRADREQHGAPGLRRRLRCYRGADTERAVALQAEHGNILPVGVGDIYIAHARLRAVTSISMRIFGSARPALIMVEAGRISPKYLRSTGQHCGNSSPLGRM